MTGTAPPVVRHVNAARALAWSNRRLIFDNDSVAVAVDEFNRRYADDPGSFADSIANTRKGIVVHQSGDVILLQPVAQPR